MKGFGISELYCIKDAMDNYKKTHSIYCDPDCIVEIDVIIEKINTEITHCQNKESALLYLLKKEYLSK